MAQLIPVLGLKFGSAADSGLGGKAVVKELGLSLGLKVENRK